MSITKRLIEKIRGFQKGDYVRVKTPYEGIFYGEVLGAEDWYNPLEEKYERLARVRIRNSSEVVFVPLDDIRWEIKRTWRRKRK